MASNSKTVVIAVATSIRVNTYEHVVLFLGIEKDSIKIAAFVVGIECQVGIRWQSRIHSGELSLSVEVIFRIVFFDEIA